MLALTRCGVPWEVAVSIDDGMRQGLCVIAGEMEGGKFNWSTWAFEEPSS